MDVPGPQKNKMELFVHQLYREQGNDQLEKREIVDRAQRYEFAPDVEVFFKEIPDRRYDESGLIEALNGTIKRRGREDAIGGALKRRERIPEEWKKAQA